MNRFKWSWYHVFMRRWGLNILSVVSLVISLLAAVLWVMSIVRAHELNYTTHAGNCFGVSTVPGGLFFAFSADYRGAGTMFPPFEPFADGLNYRTFPYGVPIARPLPRDVSRVRSATTVLRPRPGRFGHFQVMHVAMQVPNYDGGTAFSSDIRAVEIPIWTIIVAGAVLPGWRVAAFYRFRRRIRRGLCVQCGYSLAGNVSGVCPECGKPLG